MVKNVVRITVLCTRGDKMIAKIGRSSWNILATIVTRNGVGAAFDVSAKGASGSPLRIKSCVDAVEYVSLPSCSGTTWNWSDWYHQAHKIQLRLECKSYNVLHNPYLGQSTELIKLFICEMCLHLDDNRYKKRTGRIAGCTLFAGYKSRSHASQGRAWNLCAKTVFMISTSVCVWFSNSFFISCVMYRMVFSWWNPRF